MNKYHIPVLKKEVVDFLDAKEGKKYIDATIGGGGHSLEIIKSGGIVLGLDLDQNAIDYAEKNFKFQISNFKLELVRGNFSEIDKIAKENGFEKVDGIVFDLGLSSHQIDDRLRGFSYQSIGDLDMRMDRRSGLKANDLLNLLSKKELIYIFEKYGEEPKARVIAGKIVEARKIKSFKNTNDLVKILLKIYGFRSDSEFARSKSCKRVFQALRIAVNDELRSLEISLPKALSLLESNGKLVVITFHSLEDRIVKKGFINFENKDFGKVITKSPVLPTVSEININSRSKSAKLRVFEKL